MADALSQNEIDALLSAVSNGNVQTLDPSTNRGDWVAYDLTSADKIIQSYYVGFHGIHERFSRLFRMTLTQLLKKPVLVTFTEPEFMRFSEHLAKVTVPTSIQVLQIPELKAHFMLFAGPLFTYSLVDAYYGGAERPYQKSSEKGQFTSVEKSMVQKIAQLAVKDLKEAWRLNYPINLEYVQAESNPQTIGYIHGTEAIGLVKFNVEFENVSGSVELVIQLKNLEPIQNHLKINIVGDQAKEEGAWFEHWKAELPTLELDAKVELGSTQKSLAAINEMKAGDILTLGQDAAGELLLHIENQPKIKGVMGVYRGNNALRVTELLEKK